MPTMRPLLPLLFLPLLLLAVSPSGTCPQDCSCQSAGAIFCIQRRSSSVPRGLPSATRQLYAFQNGIRALGRDDFTGLGQLELLDLSQNQLSELPGAVFQPLSALRNLDLSSNQIGHVTQNSFSGLVQLERLYLHGNRIRSIDPAAFEGLEQLLELKLQGNQLTSLPSLRLPRLLLLDLSFNSIPALGPGDLQTANLESLKVADLGLTSLDRGLMANLGNLHDLDISRNQLAAMPPALKGARGLIRLNLASNPIRQLMSEDLQGLVGLQELDISGLKLQTFPVGFSQLFPRLQVLTAAENPFNCQCPLAWFPGWLRERGVTLGRLEETRCHFPPVNAGRVLSTLGLADFGCPTTTAVSAGAASSTPAPWLNTTTAGAVHAAPPPSPSELPFLETDGHPTPEAEASPSSADEEGKGHICPPNICLNGGTCVFSPTGQLECTCLPGTSGLYCENEDNVPWPATSTGVAAAATPLVSEPDGISWRQVTGTTILLDMHRYLQARPDVRGIRLTYRNLSGPDRRAVHLSVPASYPEYTLRGLRPNCTYSVCANPLGEKEAEGGGSCVEARTAALPTSSSQPRVEAGELGHTLVPLVAAAALVVLLGVVVGMVVCLRRHRRAKAAHVGLDAGEPSLMELEKGSLPQKQPEIMLCPSVMQSGVEYQALLTQGHIPGNSNVSSSKPSYF